MSDDAVDVTQRLSICESVTSCDEGVEVDTSADQSDESFKLPYHRLDFSTLFTYYNAVIQNKTLFKLLSHKWNFMGQLILYVYSETQDIQYLRLPLAHIVVNFEMMRTMQDPKHFTINTATFTDLANQIKEIFPTEETDNYFRPTHMYSAGNVDLRTSHPDGALYTAYNSLRGILKLSGLNDYVGTRSSGAKSTQISASSCDADVDLSVLYTKLEVAEVAGKKAEIEKVWRNSALHRHNSLFLNKIAKQIIDTFAVLQSPSDLVATLVLSDCDCDTLKLLKGGDKDGLMTNWPAMSKNIVTLVLQKNEISKTNRAKRQNKLAKTAPKRKPTAKQTAKQIPTTIPTPTQTPTETTKETTVLHTALATARKYEDMEELVDSNNHEESHSTLGLLLLPHMMTAAFKKIPAVREWNAVKEDSIQAFIQQIKDHNDLAELKAQMKFKHSKLNSEQQAYIVHCGALNAMQCCHVIIDYLTYDFDSILVAVDFFYKLFFVVKLEYPKFCQHVWWFLQKHLYGMDTARRISYTRDIASFKTELNVVSQPKKKAKTNQVPEIHEVPENFGVTD